MADQWFLYQDKQQKGPYNFQQLSQYAAQGLIKPEDMLWSKGMEGWTRADQIEGLFPPTQWFLYQDKQQKGPYSFQQLVQDAVQGLIKREDMVWSKGMEGWTRADQIEGLFPSTQWFLYQGKQQKGPYSFQQLVQDAVQGLIKREDMVWSKGMDDWIRADRIGDLFPPTPPVRQPVPPVAKGGRRRTVIAVVSVVLLSVFAASVWYVLRDTGGVADGTKPLKNLPLALDVLGSGPGPQQGVVTNFDLEPEIEIAVGKVGSGGGTITGGGLVISVPPGAHNAETDYRVTTRMIAGHDLPAALEAASPLYRVENGGGLAEIPIEVTIPVSVPAGEFAMGFFYDEASGRFEGMPIVAIGDGSVTVSTSHFSDFVVLWHEGMVVGQLPAPTIDTGFRPGRDDWQFGNDGSVVTPGGYCSGMSLSALWYYVEQRMAGELPLFGRFDNTDGDPLNPDWKATPKLWEDDRDGIRLVSQLQYEQYSGGTSAYELEMASSARAMQFSDGDGLTFSAFGLAMMVTGEPQYVAVHKWVGDDFHGGHAMVVYGATADGLYVADPTYPALFRTIRWDPLARVDPAVAVTGVLGPFEQEFSGGQGTEYNVIIYMAKTRLVDWEGLGGAWSGFVAGTAGDAIFPDFSLEARYVDSDGNTRSKSFRDRLTVAVDEVDLTVDIHGEEWRMQVYDGVALIGTAQKGETETVSLKKLAEGDNDYGVYVMVNTNKGWRFVDFDRITINRGTGLSPDMLPDEAEAAMLEMLVKDPPSFVENPDIPGEIVAITATYKAGPAMMTKYAPPGIGLRPYWEGWVVLDPDPDDVCMGSGFGGREAGFGPNLCIKVQLSIWDDDPAPFDLVEAQTEEFTTGTLPPTKPAYVPCRVWEAPPGYSDPIYTVTHFPCVRSYTGNVDEGIEIYGWIEEDRNQGLQHYRVRALVDGVRIDAATVYRVYYTSDVQNVRMREVVSALINEIAARIRATSGE